MPEITDDLDYILADSDTKQQMLEQEEMAGERTTSDALLLKMAFQNVFSTADGARVMNYLLEITDICSPKFAVDARYSAYLEGRRSIGSIFLKDFADMDSHLLQSLLEQKEVGLINLIRKG